MSTTETCTACKGTGYVEYLVSQHSDEKETDVCNVCKGKGVIHVMSEEDERDYWADYW
jgi:DnaJ-class molecular chaperone